MESLTIIIVGGAIATMMFLFFELGKLEERMGVLSK